MCLTGLVRSFATNLLVSLMAITLMSAAPSYTTDPSWQTSYKPMGAFSNEGCRLLGSAQNSHDPIVIAFDFERGLPMEMWLGGEFSPRSAEHKITPIDIRLDDDPPSWTLTAIGSGHDATAMLPLGKEADGFWKALNNADKLYLTINGSNFEIRLHDFQSALETWRQ